MTPDANGRLEPTEFVPPTQVIRGSPNESGFLYLTSEDGKMVVGVWACDAYCERLEDYPYTEMCTVIEGAVEITPKFRKIEDLSSRRHLLRSKGLQRTLGVPRSVQKILYDVQQLILRKGLSRR